MQLEWAEASRALAGQSVIGDASGVWTRPNWVRIAVLDGLGHGRDAAAASALALESLGESTDLSLEDAFAHADKALVRSRGAAMSLTDLDLEKGRLRWGGVGNVEGTLLRNRDPERARERLLAQSGIVGCRLPRLHPRELALEAEDLLIFYTDGIENNISRNLNWHLPLAACADGLLAAHAKATDDALVWLGRVHG